MAATPVRLWLALIILTGLSVALVWALPDEALARPVFQSPLTDQPPTVTPTLTVTDTRQVAPMQLPASPAVNPGSTAAPALPAEAPMAAPPAGERKAPGFLPPPTRSAQGSRPQTLLPGPGQPLVAPPAPMPRPTPTPTGATDDASSLARLIDTAIIALSYVWLCCGIFVLVAVTLGLVWLARGRGRA